MYSGGCGWSKSENNARQSCQPIQEKAPVYIRAVLTIDEGCLSYFEAWMSAVIAGSAFAIRASMRSTAHR
jgi:hypothetical protein